MKKLQAARNVEVVGIRWPSGRVTMTRGCVRLTLSATRKLVGHRTVRRMKKCHDYMEANGVFFVSPKWEGYNEGI